MAANPIIDILANYLTKGKRIRAVRPTKLGSHPDGIIVTMQTFKEYTHRFKTENHTEFMKLWKQAGQWWRFQWIELKEDKD